MNETGIHCKELTLTDRAVWTTGIPVYSSDNSTQNHQVLNMQRALVYFHGQCLNRRNNLKRSDL